MQSCVHPRTSLQTASTWVQVQYTYFDASQYFGTKWAQAKAKTPYGQLPVMIIQNGRFGDSDSPAFAEVSTERWAG